MFTVERLKAPMQRLPAVRSRVVGQTALYALASAMASILAAVSTAILARSLSTAAFGTYSFAVSFLLFVALFFEFGIFLPVARRVATTADRQRGELVGASLLLYVPVGLAFSLSVFALSYAADGVFRVASGSVLRAVAPLAFAYPFVLVALMIATGADKLHVYSLGALLLQSLYLVALVFIVVTGGMTVTGAVLARAGAVLLASIAMALWLAPRFRGARAYVSPVLRDARRFGIHVYLGRVLGTGTYNMDALMLAAWTDARTVGFYSLAVAIAAASGLPIQGMASALFRRMANQGYIDRRWLLVAWSIGLGCAGVAIVGAGPIVRAALSHRYEPAAALVLPLALGQVIRGVTGVYNWYLAAQGHGRQLRNTAAILTASNLALNFALIPPFGAQGAAWASVGALVANYVAHVVAYRSTSRPSRAATVAAIEAWQQ